MKKGTITLIILAFLMSFTVESAEIKGAFIFPDYQKGNVYFKNTSVVEAMLNYQTVLKQMHFKRNGEVLVLANVQTIDSVVISGRTFVNYSGEEFFEKIPLDKGALYIQYDALLQQSGKEAGYGGYSQVSRVTSLSSVGVSDDNGLLSRSYTSDLSTNELLTTKTKLLFWVKSGKKFIQIDTQSQALRAFPKNRQVILSYFKSHKVDFSSLDDVKTLLSYCYSL